MGELTNTYKEVLYAFKLAYVVLGLFIMVLSAQEKRAMWPLNLIKKLGGLLVYYHLQRYVKCLLDVCLLLKSGYGWYAWKEDKKQPAIALGWLSWKSLSLAILFLGVSTPLITYLFSEYTNTSYPYLDSLHATLVLLTYLLMAQKKIEAWIFWTIANCVYVVLNWQDRQFLILFKYLTYIPCGVYGFWTWYVRWQQAASKPPSE